MTSEIIASVKPVVAQGKNMVIVTTASGATVWVAKDQFNPNADTIQYNSRKKGEKYTDKENQQHELQSDRNEYVGSAKLSKLELLDYMAKIGVSPSFN